MMMNDPLNTAVTALEGLLSSKDEGIKLDAARTILDAEATDRRLKIQEADMKQDQTGAEIDRLAKFIIEEVPGEPSASEGAVDTAIRLIRSTIDS